MAVNNNLYPPVLETYMPAFVGTSEEGCKIYFSISSYNTLTDIESAQIIISRQDTNLSALDESKYPSGIKIIPFNTNIAPRSSIYDNTRTSSDKYYITIKAEDLQDGAFELNTYYKVQIRFTTAGVSPASYAIPQEGLDAWYTSNLSSFSEWSTVCLIRGIATPTLNLRSLSNDGDLIVWRTSDLDVVGKLTFSDEKESEVLRSYRIKAYDRNDELIEDSGDIYPDYQSKANEINYTLKHILKDGDSYKIRIEYLTLNLYFGYQEYKLTVLEELIDSLNTTITPILDEENARIGIHLKGIAQAPFAGIITIRRSSSESNFQIWEDVYTTSIKQEYLDYTWYDYTVESGVFYLYGAQKRDSDNNRGVITKMIEPVSLVFDSLYLNADGKQLRIKYNPSVSSFQRVVSDSRVETLGGKYPIIKRNGSTGYRTFPISGMITMFMDEDHLFTSKEEVYGNSNIIDLYTAYNDENRIDDYSDITWERDFREQVQDFLYKHNVKLYRSAPEGNILVKLMDINFTPEQVLSGRIYSFQCTAYEIAECSLENYDYYHIQQLTDLESQNEEPLILRYVGQWPTDTEVPANENLLNTIQTFYEDKVDDNYQIEIDYLKYLKIEMNHDPYYIYEDAATAPRIAKPEEYSKSYFGYLIYINEQPIVLSPKGVYELKGEDVQVTSLKFAKSGDADIQYYVQLSLIEEENKKIQTTVYRSSIGQEWGTFEPYDSVFQKILRHWKEQYSTYYQSLITINGMRVEADVGTVVYVREFGETDADRFVIGDTAELYFINPSSFIDEIYFLGKHFDKAEDEEKQLSRLPVNKYVDSGITVTDLNNINNPKNQWVYTLKNDAEEKQYIYYSNQWYEFDISTGDMVCPVPAIVDYYCDIVKGYYAS